MEKRKILLVFFMIMALLLSGCSAIDIFKSFVTGESYQKDNPPTEGDNSNDEDFKGLEDTDEPDTPDENTNQVILYYKDNHGYIVPVFRNMPKVEGVAKAALTAMIDIPENRNDLKEMGLMPVLPANIQIELAIKEEGLARVSFSDEILKAENKAQEENLVKAVVYTLTEFETIDKVQILVNNETVDTLTYGTDVSQPISRGDINSLNNSMDGEHAKLTLYMYNNPTGQYTYFVPVTKNVPASARNIESAVQELIASKAENLQLDVPEGTQVYGVTLDSGIAYVNFSEHLTQMTDENVAKNLMKAIALTLKEFGGVEGVQIVIDGQNAQLSDDTFTMPTFVNTYQ